MDCLRFLQEQRMADPDRWFRVKDVQEGLKDKGKSNGVLKGVSSDLLRLAVCGDLECRGIGYWKHYKEFRAKKAKKEG